VLMAQRSVKHLRLAVAHGANPSDRLRILGIALALACEHHGARGVDLRVLIKRTAALPRLAVDTCEDFMIYLGSVHDAACAEVSLVIAAKDLFVEFMPRDQIASEFALRTKGMAGGAQADDRFAGRDIRLNRRLLRLC